MGYAFISYSSKNMEAANAVRYLLRDNGVDTWMAPYDIPAGSEYAEVLYDALIGCACLVLLLTNESQDSVWVKKEVNIAISNGKTVIPVKLEDMELNGTMRLYLNDKHIVPVRTLDENSDDVRNILSGVFAAVGNGTSKPSSATAKNGNNSPSPEKPIHFRRVFDNGEIYEGDYIDGKPNGEGVYIWPDGSRYEGDFADGVPNGKGVYTWPDGSRYEGDFADGKRNGWGKWTFADGSVYEGRFVDDVPVDN